MEDKMDGLAGPLSETDRTMIELRDRITMMGLEIDWKTAKLAAQAKALEQEHENFLAAHRDNMKALDRIMELKKALEMAISAFEGIVSFHGEGADIVVKNVLKAIEDKF